MQQKCNKFGFIGLGLIGGSLARAIFAADKDAKIYSYNLSKETLQLANQQVFLARNFVDIAEFSYACDVIFINTPLVAFPEIFQQLAGENINQNVLISDTGSVKSWVIEQLPTQLSARFIPAHPIAGSEKTGLINSDPELFQGKKLIVTSEESNDSKKIAAIWRQIGAEILYLSPQIHDDIYAKISHLPQFLAFAYQNLRSSMPQLRDFTRLQNSSIEIWRDIFCYNQKALKSALDEFIQIFSNIPTGEENLSTAIAYALYQTIPNEILEYAGTGYQSFTEILHENHVVRTNLRDEFLLQIMKDYEFVAKIVQ